MTTLIIAEKPSLARSLRVIPNVSVLPAQGHLFEIDFPRTQNWSFEKLPLPNLCCTELKVINDIFKKKLIKEIDSQLKGVTEIVSAGDPDAEGSLLIFEILAHFNMAGFDFGKTKTKISRMYPLAMDKKSLVKAFNDRVDIEEDYPLIQAGLARTWADAIVGFNITQSTTLCMGSFMSVGRVQTPTLKLIHDREVERKNFIPQKFQLVGGSFQDSDGNLLKGSLVVGKDGNWQTQIPMGFDVDATLLPLTDKGFIIESVATTNKSTQPPLLPNMNDVLKKSFTLFKLSSKQTTGVLQSLYEKKAISYPRTEVRHLPTSMMGGVGEVLDQLISSIGEISAFDFNRQSKRIFDDKKVEGESHFAIYPLSYPVSDLDDSEQKVFNLIRDWFIHAFMMPFDYQSTTAFAKHGDVTFRFMGRTTINEGFRAYKSPLIQEVADINLPKMADGDSIQLVDYDSKEDQTKPPPAINNAILLDMMENIGKLYNKVSDEPVEGLTLGRPSTRTAIIELLIKREYITPKFQVTDKGRSLIDFIGDDVSVELSADFERKLRLVDKRQMDYKQFINEIETFMSGILDKHKEIGATSQVSNNKPLEEGDFVEFSKGFKLMKGGKEFVVWKQSFGVAFSKGEAEALLIREEVIEKEVKSQKGKTYSARLKYHFNNAKVELYFDDAEGVISETDRAYSTVIDGERHTIWKVSIGRNFSRSEAEALFKGEPIVAKNFKSKAGKTFSATARFDFDSNRLDLDFS